ncbi:MAG: hypothetical protein AAGF23_15830 [Acidobacteriota bacterium]
MTSDPPEAAPPRQKVEDSAESVAPGIDSDPEGAAKMRILAIVGDQPDDSSYDEILRELAFDRMIGRGLGDIAAGRTLGDLELRRRLRVWHGGRRS